MTDDEILLLDQIEHPVFVLEPDGHGIPRYTAFNRCARAIVGRPLSDILGKTALDLYGERRGRRALDRHMAALATGNETTHTSVLPLADGEQTIRTVLRPVRAEDGSVTRIIGTSTNPNTQNSARDARGPHLQGADDLEHFVHLAAHDLRAPMRHVATLANMMREDFKGIDAEQMQLIDLLEGVSEKTLALIGDLLSLAQAGEVTEAASCFEIGALIDASYMMIDPFRSCAVSRPDGWITCDRTAVQIVLRNLIDNAMKYGAPDLGTDTERRTLAFSVTASDAEHVALRLCDNGPGFDAVALEHLADGAFTNESGYGLMAIRRLIVTRGGDLQVANCKHGGAEITVTLPGRWVEDGYGPAAAAVGANPR